MQKNISTEIKERLITINDLYNGVYQKLEEIGLEYPWIQDFFLENNALYVVVSTAGKLWKYRLIVSNDELTSLKLVGEVEIDYPLKEEKTRSFTYRDSNGQAKFVTIAACSVLNRVGEIDANSLFDYFEENYITQEKEAFFTFYHLGEKIQFGTVKGVARYGKLLITWGTIDESTTLGKAYVENANDPKWGISIGFYSTEQEIVRVGDIEILAHTKGILIEQSLLLEEHAANYYTTNLVEVNRGMKKEKLTDVLKELGVAEESANEILDKADVRNREIEENKMIFREVENDTEETKEVEIEIDDTLVDQIVKLVEEKLEQKFEERVKKFETEFTERQLNMPISKIRATYRPSEQVAKQRESLTNSISVEKDEIQTESGKINLSERVKLLTKKGSK